MSKIKKFCLLSLLPALLAGCSSITNLTPSEYPRAASGYYRVEAMWNSNQRTIQSDSFKPLVVVDLQTYPKQPVPLVEDRWEAYIPVPADKDSIRYRYKFDYMEDAFHKPHGDSLESGDYQLSIGK
jgi:uncharacterized protein YceK